MFYFPLATLREIHVRPARERRVAVPRRLAVPYQHQFARFRGSQQIARPRDREALLAVPFEELVSIIFREGVLLVEEGRGPSEDVVDLEGLRGGCEQKECSAVLHGSGWRVRSGPEALVLNGLALGSSERRRSACSAVRAAFCLSLLNSMARAKTHAKRVLDRGIAGVDIFAMLEASYAAREALKTRKGAARKPSGL